MAHTQNPAEREFQTYCGNVGLEFDFEPDWNTEFGNQFHKNPDFLIRTSPAIVEVREFQTRAQTAFLAENSSWTNPVPSIVTRKPLYYAAREEAKQLSEFSATGVPLVIVLSNPRHADVNLIPSEILAMMFGEGTTSASDLGGVESTVGVTRIAHKPGYALFCGTDPSGQPENRRSHISGIAVLEQGVCYYDLSGYRLGAGPPVPDDWFTGPHDQRFGFESDGIGFGPQPKVLSQP